jgi:hypothetical protein
MPLTVAKFLAAPSVQMNDGAKILSVQSGYIMALVNTDKPIITRNFRDSGAKCIGSYVAEGKRKFLFE